MTPGVIHESEVVFKFTVTLGVIHESEVVFKFTVTLGVVHESEVVVFKFTVTSQKLS